MNAVWILIVLVSAHPGAAFTQAGFQTKDMCEAAKSQIVKDVASQNPNIDVVSANCFLAAAGMQK